MHGIFLKRSYSGTVFYHRLSGGVPAMWKPFAMVGSCGIAWAVVTLSKAEEPRAPGSACAEVDSLSAYGDNPGLNGTFEKLEQSL